MHEDLHDIDDLFKGEIEQYKEAPPQKIWEAVEAKLDKDDAVAYKKKFNASRRKTLALLLLLLSFVVYEKELVGKTYRYLSGAKSNKLLNGNIATHKPGGSTFAEPATNKIMELPGHADAAGTTDRIRAEKQDKYNYLAEGIVENSPSVTSKARGLRYSIRHKAVKNFGKQLYNKHTTSFQKNKSKKAGLDEVSPCESFSRTVQQANSAVLLPVRNMRFYDIEELVNKSTPHSQDIAHLKNIGGNHPNKNYIPAFKSRWEITAVASPQLSGSDLDNDGDDRIGMRYDEKTEIKNREKYRFSYTVGILVSWQFNRNWALQTGLMYSNTHISIDPQDIYAASDNGDLAYKYNSSSGFAYVKTKSGLPLAVGDSILARNAQQHISYLNMPILLKYKIAKQKGSITPGLGILLNMLTRATLQTDLEKGANREQVMVSKLEGTRTFFLGTIFNTDIEYHFSRSWSLNIIPSFSYSLTSVTKGNVVNTYPYSLGVGAGITYAF